MIEMKMNLMKTAAAILTGLMMTGCSSHDDPNFDSAQKVTDEQLDAVVNNYVDLVVEPTYALLRTETASLDDAVRAVSANPTQKNMDNACRAWLNARLPWESSEAFLFGPVDTYGLDPKMDTWPLDEDQITNIIRTGNLNETEAEGEQGENIRGFHTLEYLLFKDGQPRQVDSDADFNTNRTTWLAYAVKVSGLLKKDAADLYDRWFGADSDRYAEKFRKHETEPSSAANAVASYMIDYCCDIANEVGSAKIGEPYSQYNNPNGNVEENHKMGLYAVESWYSWHSIDDYSNNIRSIRYTYAGGRYDNSDAYTRNPRSLSALVRNVDPTEDARIQSLIEGAIDAIGSMNAPFRSHLEATEGDNAVKIQAAMDACSSLEAELLKLKTVLGISY